MGSNFYREKLALITGGSSGIGFGIAKGIVQSGGNVAILARHQSQLDESSRILGTSKIEPSQKIIPLQADITKENELNSILDEFKASYGTPDIVVNSAGVAHPGSFVQLKTEIFHWMMDVNYFGTVNVLKNLVPDMQKRRSGTIVNISSIAGFIGVYGYSAYGASKFAVSGFSDVIRSELKPYGINVSIVFPPDTQTPQLEYESQYKPFITKEIGGSAKLMTADEVAEQVLKDVAKGKYIILPGSEGKMLYFVQNFLGKKFYPVMDILVRSAISKIKFGS